MVCIQLLSIPKIFDMKFPTLHFISWKLYFKKKNARKKFRSLHQKLGVKIFRRCRKIVRTAEFLQISDDVNDQLTMLNFSITFLS